MAPKLWKQQQQQQKLPYVEFGSNIEEQYS